MPDATDIKVPLAFIMRLAKLLQWTETEGYGPGLTAEQVRDAESAIRGYVIAIMDDLQKPKAE
jgi:hypothetical protein